MKFLSMMMLMAMALPLMISCSKDDGDDGGGNNTYVVIKEDGTTSGGHTFSAIDDKNFYLDYIKYSVEEGHLVVSGYDKAGFKGVANIVARITYKGNTYEVLSIGNRAFSDCSGLTSVDIPNGVTSIGWGAFNGCSGLTSVTIPSSVTSIDWGAFQNCSGLTSVHIKDIVAWCNISFTYSTSGESSNPLVYAHHLYLNGKEIKSLIIPNSVTHVGGYAFSGCSGLTSVTIGNGVTSIGKSAFAGCSGLTSVDIPNRLSQAAVV